MTLFEFTVKALNTSAFIYLASCIAFIFAIARSGKRSAMVGSALVMTAFVLHTSGLLGRWYIGGISRPPWTNLYESLIFFAWGVAAYQVFAQIKQKLPWIGAFTMPLVFVLMGMSVMTPNKSIEPLIPALQSYWLKIHVAFGMIAYATFTASAALSFLHLMRAGVSMSKIGSGLSLVLAFSLCLAGGEEIFKTGQFHMTKTVEKQMPDGTTAWVKDSYREYEGGPVITNMEIVPYANIPWFASVFLFLSSAVALFWTRLKKPSSRSQDPSANEAAESGNDTSKIGLGLFVMAMLAMLSLFGVITMGVQNHSSLSWHSNPYLMMLLLMSYFYGILYFVVKIRMEKFFSLVPSAPRLDELSYKNILFAFPFQTLLLITGAIWAYYAWGRSWGWDPKETWALITWFAYLIYLHGKLLLKWKPVLLSVISLIGFVILVFAFLGVNLVLSGLHSYGAA